MPPAFASAFRGAALPLALASLLALAGCATAPVTYKTRADTAQRAAKLQSVRGAPLDIAVDEISAGGVKEKHDDLTALVGKNVADAFASQHGITLAAPTGEFDGVELRSDLNEVQALLRVITLNDAMPFGAPVQPREGGPRPLTYEVGRIDRIADALQADAVLFIFVRDQYSTGGRKAVMALAMIAGAAAGVAVVPQMGATASSAALVTRDGTVLWFNNLGAAGLDLRSSPAAAAWVRRLMAGFPSIPATTPAPRGLEALPAR